MCGVVWHVYAKFATAYDYCSFFSTQHIGAKMLVFRIHAAAAVSCIVRTTLAAKDEIRTPRHSSRCLWTLFLSYHGRPRIVPSLENFSSFQHLFVSKALLPLPKMPCVRIQISQLSFGLNIQLGLLKVFRTRRVISQSYLYIGNRSVGVAEWFRTAYSAQHLRGSSLRSSKLYTLPIDIL
jgi:hypothetical protein